MSCDFSAADAMAEIDSLFEDALGGK